ncbi:MAG: DUF1592 domain-containing protein [Planctomycetota bacterium]
MPSLFRILSASFLMVLLRSDHIFAEPPKAIFDEKQREFFKSYCVRCHNAEKQEGKLRLDDISFAIDSVEKADRWQKILNQMNSGEMPPEDAKQPERVAKTEFLDLLSRTLVTARKSLADGGGNITMRRLNRREYKNTIRDLLGVEINVRELPADGGAGTFDTVGSSLFMSSDQFEQYLAIGRQALDEHFSRFVLPTGAQPRKMHVEAEATNVRIAKGLQQRVDDHDRYVKWTTAVDSAAQKPENAAVALQIRAEKKDKPTHIYFSWNKVPGAPSPKDFGFVDAVNADEQGRRDWVHFVPHHRAYMQHPLTKTGAFLTIDDAFVNSRQMFRIPNDWPAGDYVVRVRIAGMEGIPKERRFVEFGPQHEGGSCSVISTHEITGTQGVPQVLEIPLKFSPTNTCVFMFRERGSHESDAASSRLFAEAKQRNGVGPEFALWIDWIEVESANAPKVMVNTIKERREAELHANAMVGGTYNGYFKGGNEAAKKFLETGQPQKGIPDELEAKFRVKVFEQHGPSFLRYLNDPLTKSGAYLTTFNVHTEEVITLPPDQPSGWLKTKHEVENAVPGEYMLRFRIGAVKGTPKERHFVELGSRKEKDEFSLMQTFQISGSTDAPQIIEVPVSITAIGPRTFVLREKRDVKLDHEIYTAAQKATGVGPPSALWIDWVEWEGPLVGSDSMAKTIPVVFENKNRLIERDHARKIIETFAVRAFRDKAPKPEYIEKLVKLFDIRVKAGDKFENAIKEPLSVVLATPHFLYLSEPAEEKNPRALTPLEFASRLSYFLWSAPPDETLLALARSGDLIKPDVLVLQVDRMIESSKSREFVNGFTHQWLRMDRLDFFQFNTQLYRDFDESTKAAARSEVFRTIEHVLRVNSSVRDLLKSDYVVINGILANYYGIDGISGDEFRKVALTKGSPRGGLLGMAAIMAMGSNGEVTSPVERGVWVLKFLLNNPPPPAPPAVPQLTRLEGKLLTTRERLLAHQEEPQCASCHRKIDPIGFGLENFNAVGKWRIVDSYEKKGVGKKNWTIDPSGAFHKGQAFKDYFELRDIVASKPADFSRGLAEALIEYALGRPYGFSDEDLAARIVAQAEKKEFAMREFIYELVKSKAFQTK